MKSLKKDALFYLVYAIVFIPVVTMLFVGMAQAENLTVEKVTATKDGLVHYFTLAPGDEFSYTAELIKTDPAPEAGETEIDTWVYTLDEDKELPESPKFYNWVNVEETSVGKDGVTEILFYIAVPGDLPAGVYEFTFVTENLEPRLGTTILHFTIE